MTKTASQPNVKRAKKISPTDDATPKTQPAKKEENSAEKKKEGYTGGYGKTRYENEKAYGEMKKKRGGSKFNILLAGMLAFMSKGRKEFSVDMKEIGIPGGYVDSRLPKHVLDHSEYKGIYKARFEPSKDLKSMKKTDKSGEAGNTTMGLIRCDFVKIA